ncbi:DoxX family protein [Nocardia sp. AG03]|uniref:DoxX family protein n=1 Tax=Nocardia sp. AG03 TaxID=3025312 RepID=UPI002418659E|nr:DoxX family protein [Nocardia sp. AG03]
MSVLLWILAGLLAAVFLPAGVMKLVTPYEKLVADPRMGWAKDFSPGMVKTIGALEVAGAVGIILPGLFGIAPVLVPLAAVGLGLVAIGAIITHLRRGEVPNVFPLVVFVIMAAMVAWGRFGAHAF